MSMPQNTVQRFLISVDLAIQAVLGYGSALALSYTVPVGGGIFLAHGDYYLSRLLLVKGERVTHPVAVFRI